MTDRQQNPQQYWYIPLPKNKFPQPKFHPGEQVGLSWEDECGNCCYDIGEIIGMEYIAQGNRPAQWYYRIRFLKCDRHPELVGSYDEIFEPESHLVADDTALKD
jgi:hypothetical protein